MSKEMKHPCKNWRKCPIIRQMPSLAMDYFIQEAMKPPKKGEVLKSKAVLCSGDITKSYHQIFKTKKAKRQSK